MLNITKEQFLSFDDLSKIRILQAIIKGKIKYIENNKLK